MFSVADCVADCAWLAIPQATKWERIGNQIDAAIIFARAHFVDAHGDITPVSGWLDLTRATSPQVWRKSWADWSKSEPGAALQWTWEFDAPNNKLSILVKEMLPKCFLLNNK